MLLSEQWEEKVQRYPKTNKNINFNFIKLKNLIIRTVYVIYNTI